MRHATERGRWCHQAPVGYLNCGRNAVPSLRPDPERADVVKAAFTRVAGGETPQTVYKDLVERGFTTRRRRVIRRSTLYSMLRNPVYKGQLDTKLGFRGGDWSPLVDEDIWEQVQAVVSQPGRRRVGGETRQRAGKRPYQRVREGFELRGWLSCSVCGRKLTGGVTKGYAYINCVHGHVRARANALNDRFQEWLDSVRPNEVFLERLDRAIRTELEGQKETLSRRQAKQRSGVLKIKEKLGRLNQALADGTMERDAYRETYLKLKAELLALEHDGVEDRVEEHDVDAMLKFARHLLSQPGRLCAEAATETKIELQRALFPHGLVVDRALEFSTHPSDYDSMSYVLFSTHQEDMAYHRGVCSMAELCRRYGISRPTGYKWVDRFEAHGQPGLQVLFPINGPAVAERNNYEVTADGQRFLVNAFVEDAVKTPITWVLNWAAQLEQ